jgi:hypothetical protein
MAGLDELSALIFNGTREDAVPASIGAGTTTFIYGTAMADSESGQVVVLLDNAIYAADDAADEDYEWVDLSDDDDDVGSVDDDEELEDEEEEEIVYWEPDDDDATEYDEGGE